MTQKSHLEEGLLRQIRALGLPEPKRQYRFKGLNGIRLWRFDFAWEEPYKLAAEVQGGVWGKGGKRGAHVRGRGIHNDAEKYNEAVLCGWRVLLFPTNMINNGQALGYLEMIFKEQK